MAKYKRKVNEALAARRAGYDSIPSSDPSKRFMTRPGSQNRKKGYGGRRGRR